MEFKEIFGTKARWTVYPEDKRGLPLIRKSFSAKGIKKATLTICGLGYFEAYLNGNKISADLFVPCFSDYFHRDFSHFNYPLPGETSKHRIYVCRYDATDLLREGENVLAVILGGGWLTQRKKINEGKVNFSEELYLCFSLEMEDEEGRKEVFSDKNLRYTLSHIVRSNVYLGEKVDFRRYKREYYLPGFDDASWKNPAEREDFGSPLYVQDVLADTVCERIKPKVIFKGWNRIVVDAGKNVTGWVKVKGRGRVTVCHAESFSGRKLNYDSIGEGKQQSLFIGMKEGDEGRQYFCFSGFRYAEIRGRVTDYEVEVVHIPFRETSVFESDNKVLNWLHDAYKLTQLNNMHGGIPSDCPHREKLGYTADGQLTTETALLCFDSRAFYRKWFADILDCQDEKTGHVHHTAPLMGGGGGPGGWGGGIVFAPYKYYTVLGEEEYIASLLPAMEKWLRHMRNECMGPGEERDLIVRERKGGWCLGDWCTLEKTVIAEPFVNTYLYIKALDRVKELCAACGREFAFSGEREKCVDAIKRVYLDKNKKPCQRGIQGADFFFADLGLLTDEEVQKAVLKYDEMGYFDVGIIGIEVLLDYLFNHGYEEVGTKLLCSEKLGSFGYMKNRGATTIWEYWEEKKSQDHPMFGSAVKYLFYGVAGIRYDVGFRKITIKPSLYGGLSHLKCSLVRPDVTVNVEYDKIGDKEKYVVSYSGIAEVTVEWKEEKFILEQNKPICLEK